MSHVKSGGAVTIGPNVAGKRLGIKKSAGQKAIIGNIIVKQRGSIYHPGKNTKMGNDFSIYAVAEGLVQFRRMTGYKRNQFYVDVIPAN
ncbi:50S ribosomal protein L27 [Candidatus Dojkabacteria bacterium]|nr:50S ribosomal protein L27 [Candidatus Dojkabacteria bacterium]